MKNENLDLTCINEMSIGELIDFIEDLRDCNRQEELINTGNINVDEDNEIGGICFGVILNANNTNIIIHISRNDSFGNGYCCLFCCFSTK